MPDETVVLDAVLAADLVTALRDSYADLDLPGYPEPYRVVANVLRSSGVPEEEVHEMLVEVAFNLDGDDEQVVFERIYGNSTVLMPYQDETEAF